MKSKSNSYSSSCFTRLLNSQSQIKEILLDFIYHFGKLLILLQMYEMFSMEDGEKVDLCDWNEQSSTYTTPFL